MPIVAKQIDIGSTLEQIRQQFNNLQSDVTTLQASPTYGTAIIFEGTTNDDYETSLTAQDPTADRTIYLPNENGTVLTTASVVNADTTTITANNATNETVYPIFVDGATGTQGLESDTGLTYNPSTGLITTFLLTTTGDITVGGNAIVTGTVEPAGGTSAGDNAAIGYTSGEGLKLTGQGSAYDVTLLNDAAGTVFGVPTGETSILFPDNAKAEFGTGRDLKIYHDGSHSYISEDGTGQLYIRSNYISFTNAAGSETMTYMDDDGAVNLYHDNSIRLATSAAGISVTGTATMSANVVIADAGSIGSASDTNAITISSGGVVAVTATTANTSPSDGALTVAGGVGIALDLTVGDDLRILSDGSVLLFGANSDVSLTHVHDTGLLLNSTRQLQFGDAGTYIHQSADGVLDLVSDTELELNATTIDINGNVEVSGTLAQVGVGTFTARSVHSGGITIADDGQIGSASDLDAMAISSGGVVTFTQAPVFNSGATLIGSLGVGTAMNPDASDGATLGTTALEWSDLYLADGAQILFGDDQEVTLTHVADTGLLINSTMQLQFNDASQYINAPSATVLDINATDEVEVNATLMDVNANLDVSGTYTGAGLMTTGGNIVIPNAGNIGSVGDTDSIAIDSSGNVIASQNLTVTGNLTVNGTTTTVSTSNTVIGDSLIELNNGAGSNANDLGIVMERGSTGDNAIIAWDESADKFIMGTTTATGASTGNLSITAGTLVVSALEGTLSTAAQGNITSLGTLTTLTVDNVIINGATIGHTGDTDLLTLASTVLTVAGRVDASDDIYLTGDEKKIRWYNGSNYATLAANSSLSSNLAFTLPTSVGSAGQAIITDGSGNLSFAANNVGNATTATISANNSTNETVYPTFVDGATGEQGFESDTGLTYNPSTGLLSAAAVTTTADINVGGALTVTGTTTLNGTLNLGDAAGDALTIAATTTVQENMTFTDSDKAIFGTGGDLEIYHDGTDSRIDEVGTGDLIIRSDGTIQIKKQSAAEQMATFAADGSVTLYHNSSAIAATHTGSWGPAAANGASLGSAAVEWSDLYLADGGVIYFGNDQDVSLTHVADSGLKLEDNDKIIWGAGSDGSIYSDGTNFTFSSAAERHYTDAFQISNSGASETIFTAAANGAVTLYYDNAIKLATTGSGGTLTGTWNVTTELIPDASDGAALGSASYEWSDLFLADGAIIYFGDDQEVTLTHGHNVGLTLAGQLITSTATGPAIQVTQSTAGENALRAIGSHASFTGNVLQPWTVRDTSSAYDLIEAVTNNGSAVPFRVRGDGQVTALAGFHPMTSDGAALGSTSLEFSDLYLADGAVIYAGDDQDWTATHIADNEMRLADSDIWSFGAAGDLKIYHNGSHSYIVEGGTGQLFLATNYLSITNAAMNETMASFDDDGAVSLYYDNAVKLATSSAGITVTGTVTATAGATLLIKNSSGGTLKTIKGMT